jgi:hypothetical protein
MLTHLSLVQSVQLSRQMSKSWDLQRPARGPSVMQESGFWSLVRQHMFEFGHFAYVVGRGSEPPSRKHGSGAIACDVTWTARARTREMDRKIMVG